MDFRALGGIIAFIAGFVAAKAALSAYRYHRRADRALKDVELRYREPLWEDDRIDPILEDERRQDEWAEIERELRGDY